MKSICLIFQIHQPYRFKRFRFFDIGAGQSCYDDFANETSIRKMVSQCILPCNELLLKHLHRMDGKLKIAFSLSGITLEQLGVYAPEAIDSFRELAQTGLVEFLGGTYSHSLSSLHSMEAFSEEAGRQQQAIRELTGREPEVFQNTEMIYSDEIGSRIADMGFRGVVAEGTRHILGWKSPGFLYGNAVNPRLKVLMRNPKLSDDLAFRFSDSHGQELTADKFITLINGTDPRDETTNICLDYETFGIYHTESSGIFSFLDHFLFMASQSKEISFRTPSEVVSSLQPVSLVNVANPVSWIEEEHDVALWTGNELQDEAMSKLYRHLPVVQSAEDPGLLRDWHALQGSDHFVFMSTRPGEKVLHNRKNPFHSPFDAFINYMNILNDFGLRLERGYSGPDYMKEYSRLKKITEMQQMKIEEYQEEIKRLRECRKKPGSEL